MSRKDRLAGADIFGGGESQPEAESGELTMRQADQALFGELAHVDNARKDIKPVRINEITPDLSQPRRALPSEVRAQWSGKPDDLAGLFNTWLELIAHESGRAFDLDGLMQSQRQIPESEQAAGPIETAFTELVELAVSIRRDGLTNPITVARDGRFYRLETGERRWLAYHLLHAYFNGENGRPNERSQWTHIPARIVEGVNVWRQATENTARQNLNAIGRARQFALLLMDLHGADQFRAFDQFEHERDFYAQVADGGEWRIPRGSGEMLLNAMGLKNESQLRYYRALLRLPLAVWIKADDFNTSVGALRNCLRDATGDETAMLKMIEQARRSESVSADTVDDEQPSDQIDNNLVPHSPTPTTTVQTGDEVSLIGRQEKQIINRAVRLISGVGRSDLFKLESDQKRQVLEMAQQLKRIAVDIEKAVKGRS
jgi:hypothetical protein